MPLFTTVTVAILRTLVKHFQECSVMQLAEILLKGKFTIKCLFVCPKYSDNLSNSYML